MVTEKICQHCGKLKPLSHFKYIKFFSSYRRICNGCEASLRAKRKRDKIAYVQEHGLTPKIHSRITKASNWEANRIARNLVFEKIGSHATKNFKRAVTLARIAAGLLLGCFATPLLFLFHVPNIAYGWFIAAALILPISIIYHHLYEKPILRKIGDAQASLTPEILKRFRDERLNYENSLRTPEWRLMQQNFLKEQKRINGILTCFYCKTTLSELTATVDHFLPRSKFPNLTLVESNLRVACRPCNSKKGNRILK